MLVLKQDSKSIKTEDYQNFCQFLEESCGIVLGDNKHYLVNSRLNRIMSEHQIDDLGELIHRVKSNTDMKLKDHIIDAMTTNETSWFRDSFPYTLLKEQLLLELSNNRRNELRIWSAACSSGQEPYSINIIYDELRRMKPGALAPLKIIATDISASMLKEAADGTYDNMSIARGMSDERRNRYFDKDGSFWHIKPGMKENIVFHEINLMKDFSLIGKFDLIFCRNVLIYFSGELKRTILERLANSLYPGGYLLLGGSESVTNYTNRFQQVRMNGGLIYKRLD